MIHHDSDMIYEDIFPFLVLKISPSPSFDPMIHDPSFEHRLYVEELQASKQATAVNMLF